MKCGKEPVGMFWNIVAGVAGGLLSSRNSRKQQQNSLQNTREQNRGALERQREQQAFEERLINRRNVAGGPAYGGDAGPVPDFWFGLKDQAEGSKISSFFQDMNKTRKAPEAPAGAGQVDLSKYQRMGRGDARTPLTYDAVAQDTRSQDTQSLLNIFNRGNGGG